MSEDETDGNLAHLLGLNVADVIRIPKDLRCTLLQRFSNAQNVSEPPKKALNQSPKDFEESFPPSTSQDMKTLDSIQIEIPEKSSEEFEEFNQTEKTLDFDFPTAADALASEAAFMENIGLYLNPKQVITMGRAPNTRERTASDCIEAADILMWCDQANNFVDSPSKSKPHSLLSFLNKKPANEENLEERTESTPIKWRLWNPEQESQISQDELWNDIFSSAAEYIESETSDPTLMELSTSTQVNPIQKRSENASRYYCKPCNRPLCSKEALYRHNLSELHFKRTLHLGEKNQSPRIKSKNIEVQSLKISIRKEAFNAKCPSCTAIIPDGCLGKHLVSHFHHHRSIGHPLHSQLILEHIHEIVKQAPFQCHICKFYCNFTHQFSQHWRDNHSSCAKEENVGFWCSACRILCPTEQSMQNHMAENSHLELVTMINRSVSIVIKKVHLSACAECPKKFRLKFSLLRHLQDFHPDSDRGYLQAVKEFRCQICGFQSADKTTMREHKFLAHLSEAKKSFTCFLCRKSFSSKYAKASHKSSQLHIGKKMLLNGILSCAFCGETFDNGDKYESHMKTIHIQDLSQCHLCGEAFLSPQKLGSHLRLGKCSNMSSMKEGFACNVRPCPFVGKSHELLTMHKVAAHSNRPWTCPRCNLELGSRTKFQRHLKTHNQPGEKCNKCGATFMTRLAQSHHSCAVKKANFRCSKCDYVTNKSVSLTSHMLTHQTQKPKLACPQCSRCFSRQSEVNRHVARVHMKTASKKLECSQCSYATFSGQHLKRHYASCHSDKRRFFCRLCDFASASLDNLRKHILATTKHPGSFVYECQLCFNFATNSQMEFKSHLKRAHPSQKAESVITNYFSCQ